MKLVIEGKEFDVQPTGDTVSVDTRPFTTRIVQHGNIFTVYVDEKPINVQLPEPLPEDGVVRLLVDAKEYPVEMKGRALARPKAKAPPRRAAHPGGAGAILSQMTGRVTRVDVNPDDEVAEGQVLVILEAMKMENEIKAPMAGKVKEVAVVAGARVSEGDLLVLLDMGQ